MPRTSWEALNDLAVFCPQSREQALIADILDGIDEAIRQTEIALEKLKQVKQGLLHDLLTRGIDSNGEVRPPRSLEPQIYGQYELGWVPRAWDLKAVGSEFEIELGKMLDEEKNLGVPKPYTIKPCSEITIILAAIADVYCLQELCRSLPTDKPRIAFHRLVEKKMKEGSVTPKRHFTIFRGYSESDRHNAAIADTRSPSDSDLISFLIG